CKAPLTVAFNSSPGGAASYKWLSGDGQIATGPAPSFTYQLPGSYDVTLIVTGASGCSDTLVRKNYVYIGRPQLALSNAPQKGCVPYTFQPAISVLTNDVLTSYQWDFGDGQTATGANPTHVYATAGTWTVKLIYTTAGGCTDSLIVPAAVRTGNIPSPSFDANPRITCAFQPVQFTDQSTVPAGGAIDTWLWQFGDGGSSSAQNPSYHYGDTGYFSITLTIWSNGCSNSFSLPKYVYIKAPIARFSDSMACSNRYTRWFKDRSIGALSWYWDFGDGNSSTAQNPVHTWADTGYYTVMLTVRNDTCEHTTMTSVHIINETLGFKASDTVLCRNSLTTFSPQGMNLQNISYWHWNTGNGLGIYINNPLTITYTKSGIYDVMLAIRDLNGCTDTLVRPQYIRVDGPTAAFTVSAGGVCTLSPVVFTDASVPDPLHPIVKWIWAYSDGKRDTLTAPPFQHSYSSPGLYRTWLYITDSKGCQDQVMATGAVLISRPSPSFTTADTLSCVNKPVQLINLSISNAPSTYEWRFGDGQQSAAIGPSHNYQAEGRYDIQLIVTDRYGCIDSIQRTQYIGIFNPQAVFSISDSVATCPPLVVNFSNQSAHYKSFQWNFGDGTRTALPNPLHFYTFPGKYQAKLTVTSPGGCMDSAFKLITIRGPEGSFTYDNIRSCSPDTIHFTGTTKDKAFFTWDFGDGVVTATGDSVLNHVYVPIGQYLPKMILTDPGGCRVPFPGPDTIRIYGVNAHFGTKQQVLCDSGLVVFADSSRADDPVTGYQWDFGDGQGSTAQQPSHYYTGSGQYPVKLIVTTQLGCRDTARLPLPIKIVQSPLIGISGDTGKCAPANLQFLGNLLRADTSALRWNWDLGNGQTSTQQNSSAIYTKAGSYQLRLISTNSTGCADTVYKTVESYPIPAVSAGQSTVICLNKPTMLQASGANTYQWLPVTGLSCTNCATTLAAPTISTTYYLEGQTQYGCAARDSIYIEVKQPFRLRVGPGDTLCVGESWQLHAAGAELYLWSPATGLDNAQSPNPVAKPSGTELYTVIGHDNHNCFFDTAY
ncbi:MAG: PKD domain-containing protein, partial [Bacteroidetes bacterium]|nr:PKD domain-containing protein [Bacteroidota bacterium]